MAARYAEQQGVRTIDLHAILKALLTGALLNPEQLLMLVEQMEKADHTSFHFRDDLFSEA